MGIGKSELGCSSKVNTLRAFHPWVDWKTHFDILSFISPAPSLHKKTIPPSSQSIGPNNKFPASLHLWRQNQPIISRLKQLSLDQLMLNWLKPPCLPGGKLRTDKVFFRPHKIAHNNARTFPWHHSKFALQEYPRGAHLVLWLSWHSEPSWSSCV